MRLRLGLALALDDSIMVTITAYFYILPPIAFWPASGSSPPRGTFPAW